jgi:hypothetical protein
MKIYFIRDTHDENGNYRGDSYFKESYSDKQLPFGVHTWGRSGERLTLEEIYKTTEHLYKTGACDGILMDMPADYNHSVEGMLKSLSYMIDLKLVKTDIDYEIVKK